MYTPSFLTTVCIHGDVLVYRTAPTSPYGCFQSGPLRVVKGSHLHRTYSYPPMKDRRPSPERKGGVKLRGSVLIIHVRDIRVDTLRYLFGFEAQQCSFC